MVDNKLFRPTWLGFSDRNLESDYQVRIALTARRGDPVVDIILVVLGSSTAYLMAEVGAHLSAIYLLTVCNAVILSRSCLLLWPTSPRTASWRTYIMAALRVQTVVVGTLTNRLLDIPALSQPNNGPSDVVRNFIVETRVGGMLLMSFSQRLPFRCHFWLQPLAICWHAGCTWASHDHFDQSLIGAFAHVAQVLTQMVTASMLLPTPQRTVLSPEHACAAVSMMLFLLLGVLLPSAWLFYSETKSRMEFLYQREERRRLVVGGSITVAQAKVWLEREASLAAFPLAACLMLPPLTGLLWNLLIHSAQWL